MSTKKAHKDLIALLTRKRTPAQWNALLHDLLTSQERESLAERLQIMHLLEKGMSQRDIAEKLGVSISKITRGSKVLQEGRGELLRKRTLRKNSRKN